MKNEMEKIKKILHDYLKWGYPTTILPVGGDDIVPIWICKFCGGRLSFDSQGNCFHLEDYSPKENIK